MAMIGGFDLGGKNEARINPDTYAADVSERT